MRMFSKIVWKIKSKVLKAICCCFYGRSSSIQICCCRSRGLAVVLVAIEKGHLMKTIKHEWCFWIVVLCKSKWHGIYESVNVSQITNKKNNNNNTYSNNNNNINKTTATRSTKNKILQQKLSRANFVRPNKLQRFN